MSRLLIKVRCDSQDNFPKSFSVGDWIDLSTLEDVKLSKMEFKFISLGVSMKLPYGYEAILAPRSSTYHKYGIIQANSIGIIDESFCGDRDVWKFPAIALRDTFIPKGSRICQFRVCKHMDIVDLIKVESLGCENRGMNIT